MGRTLIIDGNNLVHRYHDVYHDARNSRGQYVGGLYGLLMGVRRFMGANHDHDSVIYTVDKGCPAWRRELCPEYKAQREDARQTQEEKEHYLRYKEQVKHVRHVVRHTGCGFAWAPGWEGDDVIAALVQRRLADRDVTIYSTDNDYIELADGGRVRMYRPGKDKEDWVVPQPFYVIERCADPKGSDNLDGAPGVGKVKASVAVQMWLRDAALSRPGGQWTASSAAAMNDFLNWCEYRAPSAKNEEHLAAMSKDERVGVKAAAIIHRHRAKMVANYQATSLRYVAKKCDPEMQIAVDQPDRAAFVEMLRAYELRPILEDMTAIWPVFERLNNAWLADRARPLDVQRPVATAGTA